LNAVPHLRIRALTSATLSADFSGVLTLCPRFRQPTLEFYIQSQALRKLL